MLTDHITGQAIKKNANQSYNEPSNHKACCPIILRANRSKSMSSRSYNVPSNQKACLAEHITCEAIKSMTDRSYNEPSNEKNANQSYNEPTNQKNCCPIIYRANQSYTPTNRLYRFIQLTKTLDI